MSTAPNKHAFSIPHDVYRPQQTRVFHSAPLSSHKYTPTSSLSHISPYKKKQISVLFSSSRAGGASLKSAMATSELRLLGGWPSPFVMRPRIALNMKSLEYEFLQESFGSKSQLLLQSNPVYKKIPVLLHGDKPICESLIIVEYIDDVWTNGPSILPTDAYDRAIARFWGTYIDDKWFPALKGIITAQGEEAIAAAIEQVESGLKLLEEALEKCSKGKPFFGGESIGYVDIAFGSYLGWVKVTEIMNGVKLLDSEKLPLLTTWSERFSIDAYVKDVMPETEKLLEFARMIFKK